MEYRSKRSLRKIAGIVGNVIKVDNATRRKARLRFARVLVEMNTNDDFPKEIHFTNVKDELVTQQVVYEWKPILCNKCKKRVTMNKSVRVTKGPRRPRKMTLDREKTKMDTRWWLENSM